MEAVKANGPQELRRRQGGRNEQVEDRGRWGVRPGCKIP